MSRFSSLYPNHNNQKPRFSHAPRQNSFRQRFPFQNPRQRGPRPGHFGAVSGFRPRHPSAYYQNQAQAYQWDEAYGQESTYSQNETFNENYGAEGVGQSENFEETDYNIAQGKDEQQSYEVASFGQDYYNEEGNSSSMDGHVTPTMFKRGRGFGGGQRGHQNAFQSGSIRGQGARQSYISQAESTKTGDASHLSTDADNDFNQELVPNPTENSQTIYGGEEMDLDSGDSMTEPISVSNNAASVSDSKPQSQGTEIPTECEKIASTKPENMISSFAQSLMSFANSKDSIIRPSYEMPPFHPNSPAEGWSNQKKKGELKTPAISQNQTPLLKSALKKPKPEQNIVTEKKAEAEDSDEEDTGFCKYCNISFNDIDAYKRHTRGLLHTQKLMDYEKTMEGEGKEVFKTEEVETAPAFDPFLSIKEKDPDPRDEKQRFPDKFYCQVCDVKCTGTVTFNMHIAGSKHKAKIGKEDDKQELAPEPEIMVIDLDKPANIKKMLDVMKEPLIGLQYVTEFQRQHDRDKYVCSMCDSKCDSNAILMHVVGIKHRIRYFKEHYPKPYQTMVGMTSKKKSEQNAVADEFARDIENREGRHEVKVKLEVESMSEAKAAILVKSGALDNLLKDLTPDKLKSLKTDIAKINQPKVEGHKSQQPQGEDQWSNRPAKSAMKKPYNDPYYDEYSRDSYHERAADRMPYRDRRPDDRYAAYDRYGRPGEDNYRGSMRGGDNYGRTPYHDDPYYRRDYPGDYGHTARREDPLRRRDDPLPRREDPLPRLDDPYNSRTSASVTPAVVMDYSHSAAQNPVEDKKRALTDDEQMFQEFLVWKKMKMEAGSGDGGQQANLTMDNYQYLQSTSDPSVTSVQQPIETPSYSTAQQPSTTEQSSTAIPEIPPQVQQLLGTLSKSLFHSGDKASLNVSDALAEALQQFKSKTSNQTEQTIPATESQKPELGVKSGATSAIPGLEMLKQSYEQAEPTFSYSSMENAYKKHFTENAKKFNTFNYLEGQVEKSKDFVDKLQEVREDRSPIHDEYSRESVRDEKEDAKGGSEKRDEWATDRPAFPHDPYRGGDPYHPDYRGYPHYPPYGYPPYGYDPYAGNPAPYGPGYDPQRIEYERAYYGRDPYGADPGGYNRIKDERRNFEEIGRRSRSPVDLDNKIVLDYQHNAEQDEKIPAAYRDIRRSRSLSQPRNPSRSSSSSSSSSGSSSSSSSSSSSASSRNSKSKAGKNDSIRRSRETSFDKLRNRYKRSRSRDVGHHNRSNHDRSRSKDISHGNRTNSRGHQRSRSRDIGHRNRSRSRDSSRRNRSRSRERQYSSSRDSGRRRYSHSKEYDRLKTSDRDKRGSQSRDIDRLGERNRRDSQSRSSVSSKTDAFDTVSKAKTETPSTNVASVRVDLSEIALPSNNGPKSAPKDKPVVKKISLTLKKTDKPVHVGGKVIDMFGDDDSDSDKKDVAKNTDKTETSKYSMPLPREMDKEIFTPSPIQKGFKK